MILHIPCTASNSQVSLKSVHSLTQVNGSRDPLMTTSTLRLRTRKGAGPKAHSQQHQHWALPCSWIGPVTPRLWDCVPSSISQCSFIHWGKFKLLRKDSHQPICVEGPKGKRCREGTQQPSKQSPTHEGAHLPPGRSVTQRQGGYLIWYHR